MKDDGGPKLDGVVEIDETYIGGRARGRANRLVNKDAVIGLRQRDGKLRFIHAKGNPNQGMMYDIIDQNVANDVQLICTDDSKLYRFDLTKYRGKHKSINHSAGKYVRRSGKDLVHTNTIENAFSLLKRGIIGNFHRVSIKHLQRYLNEFSYRFNRREIPDSFQETLGRLTGFKPMPYADLVSESKS